LADHYVFRLFFVNAAATLPVVIFGGLLRNEVAVGFCEAVDGEKSMN
jgi:hypothetical protein